MARDDQAPGFQKDVSHATQRRGLFLAGHLGKSRNAHVGILHGRHLDSACILEFACRRIQFHHIARRSHLLRPHDHGANIILHGAGREPVGSHVPALDCNGGSKGNRKADHFSDKLLFVGDHFAQGVTEARALATDSSEPADEVAIALLENFLDVAVVSELPQPGQHGSNVAIRRQLLRHERQRAQSRDLLAANPSQLPGGHVCRTLGQRPCGPGCRGAKHLVECLRHNLVRGNEGTEGLARHL